MTKNVVVAILLVFVVRSLAFELPSDFQIDNQTQIQPTTTAVEKAIDPEKYLLGPGDILQFSVWGDIEIHQLLTVAHDGSISIPSVGHLVVSDVTLAITESRLKKLAEKLYPKSKFTLRLVAVRQMKVGLSGATMNSDIYTVSATDRLSTLISIASPKILAEEKTSLIMEGAKTEAVGEKEKWTLFDYVTEPKPSLRNVIITNINGSKKRIDFLRYKNTGNLDYNPVLNSGDNVFIPVITDSTEILHIFGAVKQPGQYEFVPGDTPLDIIDLCGGFSQEANKSEILIVRTFDPSGERVYKPLIVDLSNNNSGPELLPSDQIYVRSFLSNHLASNIKIIGEVKFPGIYPIQNEKTTLKDAILACGGFTSNANLASARIIRWRSTDSYDPEFKRLQNLLVNDMSKIEYEYFKIRSRNDLPVLVANFETLFDSLGNEAADIVLHADDEIEIPFKSKTVNVIGYVNSPGLVGYDLRMNFQDYINKAGGLAWNAHKNKIRLLKAGSDSWEELTADTIIEIGDTVFVPGKLETDYWLLFKELLLVASQIATLVIVVRTI